MNILMVCLGNICRSPLAEGILRRKIEEQNLPWTVDSAGTAAYHVGETPDPRSVAVARAHGIDILDQRGRQLKTGDFDRFDLILTMDSSNYQNALRLARNDADRAKVRLIMNYAEPGKNISVPDPYWDNNGFEGVYQMLDQACDALIQQSNI
ncbi:MAG: low molecular weight protein-tyrosine-phosphatase [Bacteroidota bacterium]